MRKTQAPQTKTTMSRLRADENRNAAWPRRPPVSDPFGSVCLGSRTYCDGKVRNNKNYQRLAVERNIFCCDCGSNWCTLDENLFTLCDQEKSVYSPHTALESKNRFRVKC